MADPVKQIKGALKQIDNKSAPDQVQAAVIRAIDALDLEQVKKDVLVDRFEQQFHKTLADGTFSKGDVKHLKREVFRDVKVIEDMPVPPPKPAVARPAISEPESSGRRSLSGQPRPVLKERPSVEQPAVDDPGAPGDDIDPALTRLPYPDYRYDPDPLLDPEELKQFKKFLEDQPYYDPNLFLLDPEELKKIEKILEDQPEEPAEHPEKPVANPPTTPLKEAPETKEPVAAPAEPSFSYTMQEPGAYTEITEVRQAQEYMNKLKALGVEGIDLGEYGNGKGEDGIFGKMTHDSVIATQEILGMEPNGVIDNDFMERLAERIAEMTAPKLEDVVEPPEETPEMTEITSEEWQKLLREEKMSLMCSIDRAMGLQGEPAEIEKMLAALGKDPLVSVEAGGPMCKLEAQPATPAEPQWAAKMDI